MKKSMFTVLNAVIVAGSLALGTTAMAQGQGQGQGLPGGPNVTVINTPSNPVPTTLQGTPTITGSVAVTNSPTVNLAPGASVGVSGPVNLAPGTSVGVSGTVGLTPGTNVGVSGSVNLAEGSHVGISPSGNGVQILNGATPFSEPFVVGLSAHVDAGDTDQRRPDAARVPLGKRFIVETIAPRVVVPTGQQAFITLISSAPLSFEIDLPLSSLATFPRDGNDVYSGLYPVRLYLDGSVGISMMRSDVAFTADGAITLIGYLVDRPPCFTCR